jgi:hypothetical protein
MAVLLLLVDDALSNDDVLPPWVTGILADSGTDRATGAGTDNRALSAADVVTQDGSCCAADCASYGGIASVVKICASPECGARRQGDRNLS